MKHLNIDSKDIKQIKPMNPTKVRRLKKLNEGYKRAFRESREYIRQETIRYCSSNLPITNGYHCVIN